MRQFEQSTLIAEEESCVEQLARCFPGATSVRFPVQVTFSRTKSIHLRESSLVEFASEEHAIFVSALPLEFDDKVRLEGSLKRFATDASVVAVQSYQGRKAVAVKFLRPPSDWITRS